MSLKCGRNITGLRGCRKSGQQTWLTRLPALRRSLVVRVVGGHEERVLPAARDGALRRHAVRDFLRLTTFPADDLAERGHAGGVFRFCMDDVAVLKKHPAK